MALSAVRIEDTLSLGWRSFKRVRIPPSAVDGTVKIVLFYYFINASSRYYLLSKILGVVADYCTTFMSVFFLEMLLAPLL